MSKAKRNARRFVLLSTAATTAISSITGPFFVQRARAANVYWDSDTNAAGDSIGGPGLGLAGTWNTSATQFWAPFSTIDQSWNNANNDVAVFGGGAGVVTLGAPITVGGLNFNTTGYSITGTAANPLTLGGTNNVIDLNGALNETISANLAGSNGLTLNGSGAYGDGNLTGGVLTLSSTTPITEAITGTFNINNGELQVFSQNVALQGTTNINFGGTGTFRFDNTGATANVSQNLGALTFSAGDGTVTNGHLAQFNTFLNFASLGPRATGAVGAFVDGGTTATNGTTVKTTIAGLTPNSFIDPGEFFSGGTAGPYSYAWYDAGGFVRGIAYGTDANTGTQGTGATLAGATGKNFQMTGSITAETTDSLNTLNISGASNLALAGGATLTFGGGGVGSILKTGANAATISGGTSIGTSGGSEFIIRTDVAGDALTISTPISNTTGALTKSGAGTLTLAATNAYTGSTFVNAGTLVAQGPTALPSGTAVVLTGGTLSLQDDGDGLGDLQNINLGQNVSVPAGGGITVGRLGTTALNKTIQLGTLSIGNQTLTVTPANGYGLQFTGNTTFTDVQPTTINVGGTQASNVVAGLTLSGVVSDTSGSLVGLTKTGTGTLVLGNGGNTFGDGSTLIDIQGGILSVAADGALGATSNSVVLDTNSATQGLRFTATNSYAHTIVLGQTNNDIEVTTGVTATLASPLSIPIASSILTKNDNGTLIFGGANPTPWTGGMVINAGAVQVSAQNQVGTGTITINGATNTGGAALQLTSSLGFTLANAINLNGTGNNIATGGINFGGQLENVSGANTVTGGLSMSTDAAIGADAGSVLNITTGAINNTTNTARALVFSGAGTINLNANITSATAPANQYFSLGKYGSGTLNIQAAESIVPTNNLTVWGGKLVLSGTLTGGNTIAATVQGGSTLKVDDTGTATLNRLGGRPLSLVNGLFEYAANSSGSTETLGTLTANWGNDTIQVDSGSGSATLNFSSLASNVVNGGADLVFQTGGSNANFGAAGNTVKFTTAPTLVGNLINRGLVVDGNGVNFASYNTNGISANAFGVQAYAGYNNNSAYTNINSAAAADTILISSGFTSILNTATKTLNAINISGGSTLDASPLSTATLTLTTGQILNSSGTNSIGAAGSNLVVAGGGVELGLSVAASTELDVNGTFTNAFNLTKGLGGLLKFNTPQYFNTGGNYFTINAGQVTLNGGNNTLYPGVQGGTLGSYMAISNGATLELNGNSQLVGGLRDPNNTAIVGGGGTIQNSGAAAVLAIGTGQNDAWGGSITGPVSVAKAGNGSQSFLNNNTYTGSTLILGNILTLTDYGQLSGTSSVGINYGQLSISDNGQSALPGRINPAAPISLVNGNFVYTGRAQTVSSQSFSNLIVQEGYNSVQVNDGGTGINSATVTFNSLVHPAGSTGTIVFSSLGSGAAVLENAQIGSNPQLLFNTAPATVGGVIPYAVAVRNFVGYNSSFGVGALGAAGMPAYSSDAITAAQPADNIFFTSAGGTTSLTSNTNLNSLIFQWSATGALDLGGKVLDVGSGALMMTTGTNTTVGTIQNGTITSGAPGTGGDLYLSFTPYGGTARTAVVSAGIADNGAPVRLLVTSSEASGSAFSVTLSGNNTYSGGTVVNGGTLNVGVGGNLPSGGITLNAGTLTEAAAGLINSNNTVTLNGNGVLTLTGNNTLNGIVFNNDGGTATPTVTSGGTLFLTGSTPIGTLAGTPPVNYESIPTVAGTIDFANNSKTIFVDPITVAGVAGLAPYTPGINISGVIQNSGLITKTGSGNLELSGASTFTGGVSLSAGGLVIGASSTPSAAGSTITSGPLGTGTLTVAAGTNLLSTAGTNVVANALSLPNSFNFAGLNNLTLNGTSALGGATTVNVIAPQMNATLGGVLSGSGASIVKTGLGTLTLANNNTFNQ